MEEKVRVRKGRAMTMRESEINELGIAARQLSVLIVEDDPDTCEVLAKLLRKMAIDVECALDVHSALAAVEQKHFDVVVSDLGLPDGSGFDLMKTLKGQYGIRGIALSGYGMADDIRKSIEAGFETHLTKPVTVQTLMQKIRQVTGWVG
jgi:CheY-like chemotaxis protein